MIDLLSYLIPTVLEAKKKIGKKKIFIDIDVVKIYIGFVLPEFTHKPQYLDIVILKSQPNKIIYLKPSFSSWMFVELKNKTLKTNKASRPSVREIFRDIPLAMFNLICQYNIAGQGSPQVRHSCKRNQADKGSAMGKCNFFKNVKL